MFEFTIPSFALKARVQVPTLSSFGVPLITPLPLLIEAHAQVLAAVKLQVSVSPVSASLTAGEHEYATSWLTLVAHEAEIIGASLTPVTVTANSSFTVPP